MQEYDAAAARVSEASAAHAAALRHVSQVGAEQATADKQEPVLVCCLAALRSSSNIGKVRTSAKNKQLPSGLWPRATLQLVLEGLVVLRLRLLTWY